MHLIRPLFVSTYPPDQCDSAPFTRQCADAIDLAAGPVSAVAAIQRTRSQRYDDARVIHVIEYMHENAFRAAAEVANDGPWDVVSVQYSPAAYRGEWSDQIVEFVSSCRKPVVLTFHNLFARPIATEKRLIIELAFRSQAVTVTSRSAGLIMKETYGMGDQDVRMIAPGPRLGQQYLEIFDEVAAVSERRLERRYLAAFDKPHRRGSIETRSRGPASAEIVPAFELTDTTDLLEAVPAVRKAGG